MIKLFRNTLKTFLFFPILIWINSCKNVDNLKNLNWFFYNEDQNITSLDPAFARVQSEIWVVSQIFEGLVEYDDSLKIKPSLSTSWTISDSGKTYTFLLRQNVFFQSVGLLKDKKRKFRAEDVVFSFKRVADPKTASPGAWIFNNKMDLRYFENPDSFEFPVKALNDSVVQIHLTQAFKPFLGILAMNYCYIVPKECVDADFRSHPVGTGPFMLKKWEEDVAVLLHKNPNYYRFKDGEQLPFLDGIMIENVKNKQTAFMKFSQGEYDFFNGIDATIKDELLSPNGVLRSKYKTQFDLVKSPFLNTEYLGFNIDSSFGNHPLNRVDFRKAIDFAIDKKSMIQFLRNGVGIPAQYGFVPVGFANYPYSKIPLHQYNRDSAKYYLKRSGVDINQMPELVINTTQDYLELMVFVQKELQKIGLKVKIDVHPSSFLRQLRKDQKINCFRGSWLADYPDPENFLVCFQSENFSPSGPNYFHYKDLSYDDLLRNSLAQNDEQKRNAMMAEAEALMMQSMPCVVLYYDESIRIKQKWIDGLTSNPANFLKLREVKKTLLLKVH
jgi:ABC-type transport system substrate-binding protein